MQKLGLITTLILMMVAAAHAGAQALFGRLASTPVQQFNQQIADHRPLEGVRPPHGQGDGHRQELEQRAARARSAQSGSKTES